MAPSVVVCAVSQPSTVLKFIGGVESKNGSDGSGEWTLYYLSGRRTAIAANTLNGLGGRLRSLRLGGTIRCWLPNPYGILGSLDYDTIDRAAGNKTEKDLN